MIEANRRARTDIEGDYIHGAGHPFAADPEDCEGVENGLAIAREGTIRTGNHADDDVPTSLMHLTKPQHAARIRYGLHHVIGSNATHEPWSVVHAEEIASDRHRPHTFGFRGRPSAVVLMQLKSVLHWVDHVVIVPHRLDPFSA